MDREETAVEKMPVLFVGQGPPMNAVEQNRSLRPGSDSASNDPASAASQCEWLVSAARRPPS